MEPRDRICEQLDGIFPEDPLNGEFHSAFRHWKNQGKDGTMYEWDKGSWSDKTAAFYVWLAITGISDEWVHMESIGKCYHNIECEHILRCAEIPERKEHECVYRYAIWWQSDRDISDAAFLILDVAISSRNHKFFDPSEE